MFDNANEVVDAYAQGLLSRAEARDLMGIKASSEDGYGSGDGLPEAERVLRVISGWNPARVSTAEAIQPAIDYFDAKAVPDVG